MLVQLRCNVAAMETTIGSTHEFAMRSVKSLVARARHRVHAGILAISISVLSACSTFDHYAAVPQGETYKATILGLSNARFFADRPAAISAEQERSLVREAMALGIGPGGTLPPANILSLSGGGDNGAFGAAAIAQSSSS
jgi:hypothetical protein